jgi:hypothetical protein
MSNQSFRLFWLPLKVFSYQQVEATEVVSSTPCTFEQVIATLGITTTEEINLDRNARLVKLPAMWQMVPSDVSPFQRRLVDADGNQLLKLFLESGGSGAMQLMVAPAL